MRACSHSRQRSPRQRSASSSVMKDRCACAGSAAGNRNGNGRPGSRGAGRRGGDEQAASARLRRSRFLVASGVRAGQQADKAHSSPPRRAKRRRIGVMISALLRRLGVAFEARRGSSATATGRRRRREASRCPGDAAPNTTASSRRVGGEAVGAVRPVEAASPAAHRPGREVFRARRSRSAHVVMLGRRDGNVCYRGSMPAVRQAAATLGNFSGKPRPPLPSRRDRRRARRRSRQKRRARQCRAARVRRPCAGRHEPLAGRD